MSGADESPTEDPELGFVLPQPARLGKARAVGLGALAVVLLGTAFVIGYLPKRQARTELAANARDAEQAVPRLEVVQPKPLTSDYALPLPGSIEGLEETQIYPRGGGYVRSWAVDLGDRVAAGQLLAEIDAPEVDSQLAQAGAQLAQAEAAVTLAKANRTLSRVNLERYELLAQKKLVALAEVDQHRAQSQVDAASVEAAEANVRALRANRARYAELAGFNRVVAPFAGVITARNVARGALVSATTPLFRLVATDPVRVMVQVPQGVAPSVRVGLPAPVTVREYAGRPFPGTVARAAGALDPALRTMTTEIRVPNSDGLLMPGMYAQITLRLPSPHRVFELPATALYNDAQGLRVLVVNASGKLAFVPVLLERDTGATIQIASGLTGDERVVKLATVSLAEGMTVEAVVPESSP